MNTTKLHLKPPLLPPSNMLFNSFHIRKFRFYRRRRIKGTARLTIANNLLEPFQNFLTQFPSLDSLAPVLGLASGLTLYISQSRSASKSLKSSNVGEWVLFASPTPFNRFVFIRCPSISFQRLENLSERLVEEERHFVRLSKGAIRATAGGGLKEEEEEEGDDKLEYQRVCVSTEDGGVISIDWPANLELTDEHGLDATLLLVPGTPEGSMCEDVRDFVSGALRRGFFPVVMNPRGCAGSPLTTARLFTAADSDDISTAIQFINKARPWTSLMGVGLGYGANMLTKYLAEVGERTPLIAATCINNPFDLEEASRSSPYHLALDEKLTDGLIDILRSNKELFQGRAKGFNVEKALMAKSVLDFEKAISMISYGFEEIEDFYLKSSTRDVVGNVKIPVLFIQNDDGTMPLSSTPRSLIAENPFTSLLVCSSVPSRLVASGRAAVSWCKNLTIEWLLAVELGLLKGRHPLLKDVDITFNPKKGLTLVEGGTTDKSFKHDKLLDLSLTDANGYTVDPAKELLEDSNSIVQSKFGLDSQRNLKLEEGLQEVNNGASQQTSSVDMELVKQEVADHVNTESGEVIQTAQVVMNMLDATMPGILEEEDKMKVLAAVGQGETLMKALQDAVPEDVREKLKVAISGILQAPNTNLKLERFLGLGKAPTVSSATKPKIQEKGGASDAEAAPKDPCNPEEMRKVDDLADASDKNQPGSDKSVSGLDPEPRSSENLNKSLGQPQNVSSQEGDTNASGRKGTIDLGNNREYDESINEKAPLSGSAEKGSEKIAKPNVTSCTGSMDGTEEAVVDRDDGATQPEIKRESNVQKIEEKTVSSLIDQSKMLSVNVADDAPSPPVSSTESQPMEREGSDNHKMEIKTVSSVPDQNKPTVSDANSPTFDVVGALDALTRMDDSTQVAVNSVFGVIEDMISQLEGEKENENEIQSGDKSEDKSTDSSLKKEDSNNDHLLHMNGKNGSSSQSDILNDSPVDTHKVNGVNSQNVGSNGWMIKESAKNPKLYSESGGDGSRGNTSSNYKYKEEIKNNNLVGGKFLADYADRPVNSIPLDINANPYRDFLQNEYFHRYLLSKTPKNKPLDLDTTTTLLLDYFPEDGQWKLLEQPEIIAESTNDVLNDEDVDRNNQIHPSAEVNDKDSYSSAKAKDMENYSSAKLNDTDSYIEPSYVLLDSEKQQEPVEEYRVGNFQEHVDNCNDRLEEIMQFVKTIILDALRVEISRKLSADDMKEMECDLARDLEQVANAVSLAVGHDKGNICLQDNVDVQSISEKIDTLQGEDIVRAISSAVQTTNYLGRVLPVGVVIGCSLATLRKYFNVGTRHENAETYNEHTKISLENNLDKSSMKEDDSVLKSSMKEDDLKLTIKSNQTISISNASSKELEKDDLKSKNSDSVMVGAVTAALGASALLVQQQTTNKDEDATEIPSNSLKERVNHVKEVDKVDEEMSERNQNLAASLAEKALSVAGPVVPTKEDGEVDQERLVAMLADLGQKGGLLRLVGKVALLWGGIRGAVSLTDRLISFLHVAERPLYQRVIGFASMVLLLWSPVVVPLLPTLVQSWTTSKPSKFAEIGAIIGLYTAVMILVMLWGKRIRGYEDPLEEYGLDLSKPSKIQNFFISLIGGFMIVLSTQSMNALLGFVYFCWPSSLPTSSLDAMASLRAYGVLIILACRGIITAAGVVLVEELLFRAWLPEEIASDLGYHQGIIISGLAFSLLQRSLWAVPGLWLFSFALAGFRQRSQGSLSIPIGLRTGIMATSFFLITGGFLTSKSNYPLWVTGTHQSQPFSGIVGLAFSLILAIILYPRQPLDKKKSE